MGGGRGALRVGTETAGEKGIVEEAHDSLWYAGQVEAWQREVDADGQDEKAWRNLFEAAWGLKSCSRGKNDGGMPRILERMERAIPETYTYNICAYRASQGLTTSLRKRR